MRVRPRRRRLRSVRLRSRIQRECRKTPQKARGAVVIRDEKHQEGVCGYCDIVQLSCSANAPSVPIGTPRASPRGRALFSAILQHILEGESEVKRSESDKKSVKTNNMISITILFNGKSSIPRPKSQL
jgi:hypothetical protein